MTRTRLTLVLLLSCVFRLPALAGDPSDVAPSRDVVNPLMIAPFVALLAAIALMPLVNKRWWEKNYPFVCAGLGGVTLIYYLAVLHNPGRMLETAQEYFSFIVLIGSLFVVSGGILIRIRGKATPAANAALLAVGAVLSNLLGTTGASMVLIRPYLRMNKSRLRGYHVVFFIFIVSNMGGALTPIGDPPLFLGYLRGIPFFWVMENVWEVWLAGLLPVLAIFLAVDWLGWRKTSAQTARPPGMELLEEAHAEGLHNVLFLGVILLAVFIREPRFMRELLMLLAAAGSYATTKRDIHRRNEFTVLPIKEVAVLFLGIFATMVPALDWLEMNAAGLGPATPGMFFWSSGILSSVLDNAPTYLSFLSASIGVYVDPGVVHSLQQLVIARGADLTSLAAGPHAQEIRLTFAALLRYHADMVAGGSVPRVDIQVAYLLANQAVIIKAISIGAVFFGACTYIGNGPNFMVRSIAEHMGAECPGFLGYILKYTFPVLVPVFLLIWLFFFHT